MNGLWISGAKNLERRGQESLVVIGNFDGVHRGHQALLAEATARSKASGLAPVVLTFSPHPAEALGRAAPPLLTPIARKVELLKSHAPDVRVVVQPFDAELASWDPLRFATFLREDLGARGVVVGQNFRFGRGRAGDFAMLRELGAGLGFWVEALALRGDERGTWSSTRVRSSLASGALDDASFVLGRHHELDGVVVPGQQRARTLGFPTANLAEIPQAIPAFGVYAVRVARAGEAASFGGVANIGLRPTVAAGFAVEAHLFDHQGDLYGARLRLSLVARLRAEQAFSGLEALKQQIHHDAAAARAALAATEGERP